MRRLFLLLLEFFFACELIFFGIAQQVTRLMGMRRSLTGSVGSALQQVAKAFRTQKYDSSRDFVAVFYTMRLGKYI